MDDAPGGRAIPPQDLLRAQRPETSANLLTEEFRLFPSRKVPTFIDLVVVDQFGKRPLCPAPRGWIEFVREDAHGNRDGYALGVEIPEFVLPLMRLRNSVSSASWTFG